MRALFCAIAFVLYLVPCFSKTPAPSRPVTIIYQFDKGTSEASFREMQNEIQHLLQSSAITPVWRERRSVSGHDLFENLVVVTFHGACQAGHGEPAENSEPVLGRSHVMDGEVQPFVDIECDPVQKSLRSVHGASENSNADTTLGRALARVLAHELYHVLARTTSHASTGIAKSSLSGADLVSLSLPFTPAEVMRMKSPQEDASGSAINARGPAFVQ